MTSAGGVRAPEPRGLPLIGHGWDLLRRPGRFLLDATARLGPSLTLRVGPERLLLVSSPGAVRELLVDRATLFTKGYEEMQAILGTGLLMAEGERWRCHRALMAPLLTAQAVQAFVPIFEQTTNEMLDRWRHEASAGRAVDAHRDVSQLTLRIAGLALLGIDLADRTAAACDAASAITRAMFVRSTRVVPLPQWLPVRSHRELRDGMAVLREIVAPVVADRGGPAAASGVLTRFIRAADAAGVRLADDELRDEAITMLLAGHETTASVLAWTLMLLAQHGAWTDRVRDGLAGRQAGEGHPELRWALLESMRLFPPGWFLERRATTDTAIDGFAVPAGTKVAACPWALHRSPREWPEPEAFVPERFGPASPHRRDPHAHIPFSAGPRQCVGMSFAMLEMQTVLTRIVQRFRFTLVPGASIAPEFVVTLRPRHGVPLQLTEP